MSSRLDKGKDCQLWVLGVLSGHTRILTPPLLPLYVPLFLTTARRLVHHASRGWRRRHRTRHRGQPWPRWSGLSVWGCGVIRGACPRGSCRLFKLACGKDSEESSQDRPSFRQPCHAPASRRGARYIKIVSKIDHLRPGAPAAERLERRARAEARSEGRLARWSFAVGSSNEWRPAMISRRALSLFIGFRRRRLRGHAAWTRKGQREDDGHEQRFHTRWSDSFTECGKMRITA
jgi:hypothetical protein